MARTVDDYDYDPYELWRGFETGSLEAMLYETLEETFENEATVAKALDEIRIVLISQGLQKKRRIDQCLEEAQKLHSLGYYGAAVTRYVTGMELTVRDLLFRPALRGFVLYGPLRDKLSNLLATPRKMSASLKLIGIDLDTVFSDSGESLAKIWKRVVDFRNAVVHEGESGTGDHAKAISEEAQECVRLFREGCLRPFLNLLHLPPNWL